jgi:16S rRNA (cytosine967-C5)-methyltransferase
MRLALRLNQRFQANEASVPLSELRAKAVPAWTAEQMEVSDDWLRSLQREPKLWLRAKRGTAESLAEKLPARKSARCCRMPCLFAARKICSRRRNFTRANLRSRTSRRRWSVCSAPAAGRDVVGHLRGRRRQDAAPFRLDAEQRPALGERPRGMASAKTQAPHGRAKVFNYRSVFWDGGKKLPTKTKFDGVLVDAPCSGIGTWQRNPQARWTTTKTTCASCRPSRKNCWRMSRRA